MEINRYKHYAAIENDVSFCWDIKVGCFTFSQKFYNTFISEDCQTESKRISNQLPFEGKYQLYITALLQECYFSNTEQYGCIEHQTRAGALPTYYGIKLSPQNSEKPNPHEIVVAFSIINKPEHSVINNLIVSKWNRLNRLELALIEFDENENIICANLSWSKYIGLPYWILFSVPFTHLIHPVDRPTWQKYSTHTYTSAFNDATFNIRILHSSGTPILMACRVSSLLNSDGKMLKTFMFTPSSQKHEQQIKNIPHHQIAIEQTQEGIAIVNVDQKFIYLNQAHVELFGYTSELELIGKTWHILYDHEEQTRIANEIFPNFDNQKSIRFESRGIKKDGTPIFQNVCLTRSQNGDIICSTHDITERKEQENRLKEIAIIAKVTTMMVLVTDKHGTITWVNKSFSQKTNWQAKEIIGQSILKILSTETQIFDDAKKWH